jgi:hypothetical protein
VNSFVFASSADCRVGSPVLYLSLSSAGNDETGHLVGPQLVSKIIGNINKLFFTILFIIIQ